MVGYIKQNQSSWWSFVDMCLPPAHTRELDMAAPAVLPRVQPQSMNGTRDSVSG